MNKRLVNRMLPEAVTQIETLGFKNKNGKVPKEFRGQISAFGAAVNTGSLLSAAAYFNKKNQAAVNRKLLVDAINNILYKMGLWEHNCHGSSLFDSVKNTMTRPEYNFAAERELKECVLSCALSIKLALNLFDLDDGKTEQNSSAEHTDAAKETTKEEAGT